MSREKDSLLVQADQLYSHLAHIHKLTKKLCRNFINIPTINYTNSSPTIFSFKLKRMLL